MPWLEKDNHDDETKNLLFVHVPRCGGTSLMKSHNVPHKATEHSSYYHKVGMKVFFHRYKLLETANFPIWTSGNALCAFLIAVNACFRFVYLPNSGYSSSSIKIWESITTLNMAFFVALILGLTFVFVAPTIGRVLYIRRAFLVLVQYGLQGAMESLEYLTGTNIHGYLPHLTAHKMLHYGYVTPKQMEEVSSLAIVRNPYSRMVSIYMYNRFGSNESFNTFIRSWYNNMKYYRDSGEMEEWYTPCHVIPQFEYTHFEGTQLIQSIVKQEELKYLKHKDDLKVHEKEIEDGTVRDLPQTVRDALLGMPHANKRKTSKPWYELYDQETLNMTYEMYRMDFEIFEYAKTIPQRPDLSEPPSIGSESSSSSSPQPQPVVLSRSEMMNKKEKSLVDIFADRNTTTTTSTNDGGKKPVDPPAILFESFSRDTHVGGMSSQRSRRSSLLLKSASIRPASRSSMMMGDSSNSCTMTSSRNDFFTQSTRTMLSDLIDDSDEDNTDRTDDDQQGKSKDD